MPVEPTDPRAEWATNIPLPVAMLIAIGDVFLGAAQIGIALIVGKPALFIVLIPSGVLFLLIGIAQGVRALRRRKRIGKVR